MEMFNLIARSTLSRKLCEISHLAPVSFPLKVSANSKRPAFVIRLMERDEVKIAYRLQQVSHPLYLVEEFSFFQRRFDAYPQGSLVACMKAEDVLQHAKELPGWTEPDANGSIVIGFLISYPWPERLLADPHIVYESEADFDHIEEAKREKSTIGVFDSIAVGLKGIGIGGTLTKVGLAHYRQMGYTKITGVSRNENAKLWEAVGFKIVRELKEPLAIRGLTAPSTDRWYSSLYEFK